MNCRTLYIAASFTAILALSTALAADGAGLPGDRGKPGGDGVPHANPPPGAVTARPAPPPPVAAPPVALALEAAQAAAQGCKQYPLGIAVVNAAGTPIVVYIPDGSEAGHAYTAIRKAYTAVAYKMPTSELGDKTLQDAALSAKIGADPNLVAFKGGIPLKVGDKIVGAIGVSGAEPGEHDEECGQIGVAKIEKRLK